MDPLSAASGIAGLIAVAFKTIQIVSEYVIDANEHKKHAEELRKELVLLKEVLDQLSALINDGKRSGEIASVDGEHRNTVLGKAFIDCTRTIEKVQEKLKEPVGKFRKAMAKLKWPFDQKDVLRIVDSLRRYTQLFQLSLTVANCELLSKTFDAASEGLKLQREKCKDIERLCGDFPDMAKTAKDNLQQTEILLEILPTFLQDVSLDIKEIGLTQREAERREQGERLCYSIFRRQRRI
jgi:Fungal N-terminal domain of STAND proteins